MSRGAGHSRPRTSLIAARLGQAFAAPLLFAGIYNTPLLNSWLAQELCPLLTEKHGVVRDNVSFHKSAKTQELLNVRGAAFLFLSPYSPDLNPLEHDFATLKKIREYNEHETLDNIIKTYK